MKLQTTKGVLLGLSIAALAPLSFAQDEQLDVFELETFSVEAMKTFSDQAIAGTTPVAFTEVGKESIAFTLGSRDIPLVLNQTPSVYASADSGGAGDARVNVRGFNQRNVSILINGVPTNDIENGWLYWSNWDGLGDVTSTIQVQRGLSNVTLPTPSIGGTMNIITDPASSRQGGSIKVEAGSDSFYKMTVVGNTGLVLDKSFALTLGLVAKTGDGFARGTWTDGWAYYLGATYIINDKNRLELFAIGAPQRHGQRTFASNIAAYDLGYARKLGYTDEQLYGTPEDPSYIYSVIDNGPIDAGLDFNPNYAPVSSSYQGRQYFWGGTHRRHDADYLNERENYYHKPQVNLNWYLDLSEELNITSVFYYSGGVGGGSGTLYNTENVYGFQSGSRAFGYISNSDPTYGSAIDWDRTIAANAGDTTVRGDRSKTPGESLAILRNSVNEQDQWGVVSKASYQASEDLKIVAGVDLRTAKLYHYREVRDLLGGNYFIPAASDSSVFWTASEMQLGLGDKVDYFNINRVDWYGSFVEALYDKDAVSAFAVYGYSVVDYSSTNPFKEGAPGKQLKINASSMEGHQIKGGVNYELDPTLSVFVNAGWVSKAPIYDGVISDQVSALVENPENEEFTSFETGGRFETEDKTFNVSANFYYTQWRNRTDNDPDDRASTITYIRGIDSDYYGVEVEAAYQPNKWFRLDFAASIAKWQYQADAQYEEYNTVTDELASSGDIYLKDVMIGDAPQTQFAYSATVYPTDGLSISLQGRSYMRYWADYEAKNRTQDPGQPWKIPSYDIFDLHLRYAIPYELGRFDFVIFAHVFNLFDETYISDATDNSSYEGATIAPSHSAQRAEVFFGTPRTYNFGIQARF